MVMRAPRALLVTGAYAPEFSAGGMQCQAAARILQARTSFHVLTTATIPALTALDTIEGIPVSRVFVRPGSWWSALRATWRMFAALTRLLPRVDLVHIQGYTAKNILVTAMAKLFSRPIVLHLQTARHDEPLRPVVRLWGGANPLVQGVGGLGGGVGGASNVVYRFGLLPITLEAGGCVWDAVRPAATLRILTGRRRHGWMTIILSRGLPTTSSVGSTSDCGGWRRSATPRKRW